MELKSGEGITVEDSDGKTYFIARIIDMYTCTCTCPEWQLNGAPPHRRICKHLKPYRSANVERPRGEFVALSRHDRHMEYLVESIDSLVINAKDMFKIHKYDEALKYLNEADTLVVKLGDGKEYMSSEETIRNLPEVPLGFGLSIMLIEKVGRMRLQRIGFLG